MRAFAALLLTTAPLVSVPLLTSLPVLAAPAMPAMASGIVTDAQTGRPLGGVFVQQEGGLSSTFTGAEGTFALTLDPTAQARITFTSNGYDAVTLEVGKGSGLRVTMRPLTTLVPPSAAPLQALLPDVDNVPILPLDSRVAFAYRARYESQTSNNATLAGGANNDYRLAARYRWTHWLFEADGAHHQVPVDVSGLSRDLNPAFDPSTWEAGARVGYILPLIGGWESAWGVAYRFKNTVPNNHDVPYIGNGADFEQTRHGFGVSGTLGWTSPRSPWGFEGSVAAFPAVYAWAKDPGQPFGNQFGVEANAGVSYEIVHGLRLGLDYRYENWQGNGSDTSHILAAQVFYTPVGIFKGSDK